jgi:hypothetical protein
MMHKQASQNRHQRRAFGKGGRRIGTMELAQLLRCHPASIPRLVAQKRIPPPRKILNKNDWDETQIVEIIEAGGI